MKYFFLFLLAPFALALVALVCFVVVSLSPFLVIGYAIKLSHERKMEAVFQLESPVKKKKKKKNIVSDILTGVQRENS
jgi:hypothetical protein